MVEAEAPIYHVTLVYSLKKPNANVPSEQVEGRHAKIPVSEMNWPR